MDAVAPSETVLSAPPVEQWRNNASTAFHPLAFQELQFALTARSGEVNGAAFDVQVFISERAQDMAPEQSRQLLGQLQQLQSAFHLASGQAQAWADALSAQRAREEERQRRERVKEEEKEREGRRAREREVWKKTGWGWLESRHGFPLIFS